MPGSPPTTELLGLHVSILSRDGFLEILDAWMGDDIQRRLYCTEARAFNLASADEAFRLSLNSADVLLCEGIAGTVGSWVAGTEPRICESLNTMTWIDDYLNMVVSRGKSVYLLGDEPEVVAQCAQRMRARHPTLEVVGAHHGFFDREGAENERLLADLMDAGPDVVIVGMGHPRQEFWIDDNLDRLPTASILALGGMIRWYSGVETPWADWMVRWHVAWLGRLVQHPLRHFRRYVIGNPVFLWRCLMQRWGRST